MDNSALTEACRLSDAGAWVHWLRPQSKAPISDKWTAAERQTADDLRMTYSPSQNLGAVLGREVGTTGLYLHCLDLDVRDADAEADAVECLLNALPDQHRLPRVRSGSGLGGMHIYFLAPRALRKLRLGKSVRQITNAQGKPQDAWQLDLLGDGQQVVLPPSIHPSGGSYRWEGPSLAEILEDPIELDMLVLSDAELEKLLGSVKSKKPTAVLQPAKKRAASIDDVRLMLDHLPEDWVDDRDEWLKVGMALHQEWCGSVDELDALELWKTWSARSEKYDEKDLERVWKSFGLQTPEVLPITLGSLYKAAGRQSPEDIAAVIDTAKSLEQAISAVAKLRLTGVQTDLAVSRLYEYSKDHAPAGVKPVGRTVIAQELKKQAKKIAQREAAEGGDGAYAGLEAALAEHLLKTRFTWSDGNPTLICVNGDPWVWVDGCWQFSSRSKLAAAALGTITELMQPLKKGDLDSDIRRALRTMLMDSGRHDTLDSLSNAVSNVLIKLTESDDYLDPVGLMGIKLPDDGQSYINCRGSMIRIDSSGKLHIDPQSPAHWQHSRLSVSYDPSATCPLWLKTLNQIFSSAVEPKEVIRHLQELFGYALQNRRNHAVWVYFFGPKSRNGKGTVAHVLCSLIGEQAILPTEIEAFAAGGDNHARAQLVGKKLLIDDDVAMDCMLPDGFIKAVSEQKQMTANPKGGKAFSFYSNALPLLLANHHIKTRDASPAMVHRAHIIRFDNTFTDDDVKTDKDLKLKLRQELPGILNWSIAGYQRLVRRKNTFDKPAYVKNAVAAWATARSATASFIAEVYALTGSAADTLSGQDLYSAFQAWAAQSGHGQLTGRNTFYAEIENMPGVLTLPGTVKRFSGIRRRDQASPKDTVPAPFFDDLI